MVNNDASWIAFRVHFPTADPIVDTFIVLCDEITSQQRNGQFDQTAYTICSRYIAVTFLQTTHEKHP